MTALEVKPGKKARPGVGTERLHDTGKQELCEQEEG